MCVLLVFFQERWVFVVSDPSKLYEVKIAHKSGAIMKISQSLVPNFEGTTCVDFITKKYYWPGLTVYVTKYLASSHQCQNVIPVEFQKANDVLHPIPIVKKYGAILVLILKVHLFKYMATVLK